RRVADQYLNEAVRHDQADTLAVARQRHSAATGVDGPSRVDVPMNGRGVIQGIDAGWGRSRRRPVVVGAADEISDDDEIAVQRQDAPAVLERRISVVRAVEVIEGVVG